MSDNCTPIAASESKSTFMHSLGLQTGLPDHERIYKLMKEDAVNAYRRVVRDRQAAFPDEQQEDASRPRYAYTQIDKDIIRDAIASIYQQARDELKPFYDRGVDANGDANWVIRWLLWHTFRYRDSRNKRQPTGSMADNSGGQSAATEATTTPTAGSPTAVSSRSAGTLPYDPVRG